jgi:hypothetical protein
VLSCGGTQPGGKCLCKPKDWFHVLFLKLFPDIRVSEPCNPRFYCPGSTTVLLIIQHEKNYYSFHMLLGEFRISGVEGKLMQITLGKGVIINENRDCGARTAAAL